VGKKEREDFEEGKSIEIPKTTSWIRVLSNLTFPFLKRYSCGKILHFLIPKIPFFPYPNITISAEEKKI
jgi:hypothetical protein